jgi:hypothetical protein
VKAARWTRIALCAAARSMIRRLERDFFVKSIDGYVTFNLFSVALAKKLPISPGDACFT